MLENWTMHDSRVSVVRCNTGKPHFPSIVHPERFKVLAQVFNTALDNVDYDWTDFVLILPVDILYGQNLLEVLVSRDVDVVAPLVFQEGVFYDIWAFTLAGKTLPPFREEDRHMVLGAGVVEMDTIGGTALIRSAVLKAGTRYTPTEVDRGFCREAKSKGFRVFADTQTRVEHLRRAP